MATSAGQQGPTRRKRWHKALPAVPKGDAPWAKCRPEIAELDAADHALLVRASRAWQEVMVPACEAIDSERSSRGLKWLYSSEELELALLFGRASGHRTYKKTRLVLAADNPTARTKLGFDRPRNPAHVKARMVNRCDGVPSEATISRHKKRVSDEMRRDLWMEVDRRLLLEHLETPELQNEALTMNLDGSPLLTHFSAPRASKKYKGDGVVQVTREEYAKMSEKEKRETKRLVVITCEDGGYRGRSAGADKAGDGWNLVMISTSTGVPLSWELSPLHHGEPTVALSVVREKFAHDVAPYLPAKVKVLSADGAFHKHELRAALRQQGIVENIHPVSHADRTCSKKVAAKFDNARYPIEDYPNWTANGHREVFCRCGRTPARRIDLTENGRTVLRLEGECEKCGPITITSGEWRFTPANKFVRCHPNDPISKRDLLFGNSLTYNDWISEAYGRKRFGHNEGLHGTLSKRYGLIRHKRWFRKRAQAEVETAMTFSLMHAIALEQRRRARAADPPPLAQAA